MGKTLIIKGETFNNSIQASSKIYSYEKFKSRLNITDNFFLLKNPTFYEKLKWGFKIELCELLKSGNITVYAIQNPFDSTIIIKKLITLTVEDSQHSLFLPLKSSDFENSYIGLQYSSGEMGNYAIKSTEEESELWSRTGDSKFFNRKDVGNGMFCINLYGY